MSSLRVWGSGVQSVTVVDIGECGLVRGWGRGLGYVVFVTPTTVLTLFFLLLPPSLLLD